MAIDNPFNPEICFATPVGRMCFPILSSPTFPSPPAGGTKSDSSHTARCIAMGAAEIHGSVFRKLRSLFEEAGRDRKTFARGVLDQFRKSGQISQVDERDLLEIVEIVFSRDRKDVHTHLRRIYERVIDCVFHANLDTDSRRIWTVIPRQTGHRFQRKLDSHL